MSRRRSGLDDVVELAALLPWWLSLVIAIVAESRVGPRQATQPKSGYTPPDACKSALQGEFRPVFSPLSRVAHSDDLAPASIGRCLP